MDAINRSPVRMRLRDVRGALITDRVQIKFYNQRARSLNSASIVECQGEAVTLPEMPAFPFGLAEVFINPEKYRHKSIFLDVPAGEPGWIDETCMIDPGRAHPVFPPFAAVQSESGWADLFRVLRASGITAERAWNGLTDGQKAGLFNLYAKMQQEVIADGRKVFAFVERIMEFRPERVFAQVGTALLEGIRSDPARFDPVSGALHDFPAGWNRLPEDGSFKTHDRAGSLQLTFADNSAGSLLADIDIDDHQGLQHAADVLRHKITGRDTHPYDIHQILLQFQGLDPGYDFA